MRLLTALLASAFALSANGQAQLLPAGKFSARDGRPGQGKQWEVSDAQGLQLAADINTVAARTPIVIDYEHQTLRAEDNGQPAPAAGWIKRVDWRNGQGLFAEVEWTAAAKARIEAGEYRYISPVITYDKASGAVTGLQLAALVNHPALLGMEPVVAKLSTQFAQETPHMDLAILAALIGLAAGASEADIKTKITEIMALAAKPPALTAPLIAALGLEAKADEAAVLSAIGTLKTKGATDASLRELVTQLQGQVATLTAQTQGDKLKTLLDQAEADMKIVPANRKHYEQLGKQDMALLTSLIEGMPVLEGLQGQSGGKDRGAKGAGNGLDANDLSRKALAHQTAQLAAGIQITTAEAVAAVMAGAK